MANTVMGGAKATGGILTATQAAQAQSANPLSSAANQKLYGQDVSTVESDLADNNFAGAWSTALQSSGLFDAGKSYTDVMKSQTTDPLLAALENNPTALDPSKQWTSAETSQFYNAFNSQGAYHGQQITGQGGGIEALGADPSGLWGNAADIASGKDAQANISAAGDAPDVARFAGSRPSQSFLSKYGADIGALALTAVTAGAAAPLAGAVLGGTTALDVGLAGAAIGGVGTAALDAATGKPLTFGSVAGGALSGVGASGALTGLGSAVGNYTGLGNTVGGGLVGAGVGAAGSALSGGNIALGAASGGINGAIKGSGVGQTVSNAAGGGVLGNAAGAVTNAGLKYAGGLASSALFGNTGGQGNMAYTATNTAIAPSYINSGYGSGNSGYGSGNQQFTSYGAGSGGSTDSTLGSVLTGALPGVLQAGATAGGALAASNAQVGAQNNIITTNQNNLANISSIWNTQQQLGQGADTALGSALGTNGQPANYSNFENMPGYQFAVNQGTQAIQRQAAAMGSAYTPNTAAAVGQYVTGTASQDYNTYISQLMGAAGLGTTANQGLQTANQQTSDSISNAQNNIGQAQASAYNTSGTALGGLFSNKGAGTGLIGAAGNYLFGNGSGSGGGGSGNGVSSNSGLNFSDQNADIDSQAINYGDAGISNFNDTGVPGLGTNLAPDATSDVDWSNTGGDGSNDISNFLNWGSD